MKSRSDIQKDHRDRRRATGLQRKEFWLTPDEHPKVIAFIKRIRKQAEAK